MNGLTRKTLDDVSKLCIERIRQRFSSVLSRKEVTLAVPEGTIEGILNLQNISLSRKFETATVHPSELNVCDCKFQHESRLYVAELAIAGCSVFYKLFTTIHKKLSAADIFNHLLSDNYVNYFLYWTLHTMNAYACGIPLCYRMNVTIRGFEISEKIISVDLHIQYHVTIERPCVTVCDNMIQITQQEE